MQSGQISAVMVDFSLALSEFTQNFREMYALYELDRGNISYFLDENNLVVVRCRQTIF